MRQEYRHMGFVCIYHARTYFSRYLVAVIEQELWKLIRRMHCTSFGWVPWQTSGECQWRENCLRLLHRTLCLYLNQVLCMYTQFGCMCICRFGEVYNLLHTKMTLCCKGILWLSEYKKHLLFLTLICWLQPNPFPLLLAGLPQIKNLVSSATNTSVTLQWNLSNFEDTATFKVIQAHTKNLFYSHVPT